MLWESDQGSDDTFSKLHADKSTALKPLCPRRLFPSSLDNCCHYSKVGFKQSLKLRSISYQSCNDFLINLN